MSEPSKAAMHTAARTLDSLRAKPVPGGRDWTEARDAIARAIDRAVTKETK